MLEGLDSVPWEELEQSDDILTAYDPVTDVPIFLRQLLSQDTKERSQALDRLYENALHQGSRFPITPYIIPFIIELCANPSVPDRVSLLCFWSHAITGYFSVRERPCWGDGETIYWYGKVDEWATEKGSQQELHQIYRESLKGKELLANLLKDDDFNIRGGAAWVLACMPTIAEFSVPKLEAQLNRELSGWVRAGIVFALGELGATIPLQQILEREFSAAKCMAVCQLTRIAPDDSLIEPLLEFVSKPIKGYENVFGAGGKSTDDAAFAISYLPRQIQQRAIPAICQRLKEARLFDTIPLVETLLCATFERRNEPLTELTVLQKLVLSQMLTTDELWTIGNLIGTFRLYGLPDGLSNKKEECAKLVGIEITQDDALAELRIALTFAEMGFLEKAREGILKALDLDSTVLERVPAPEECWLLYAKAFAETEPERAIAALRRAILIDPGVINKLSPTWHLSDLLKKYDF